MLVHFWFVGASPTIPLGRRVDPSSYVESLRADIHMILEARVPESEAPSAEPAEDTVIVALFATFDITPPPSRE